MLADQRLVDQRTDRHGALGELAGSGEEPERVVEQVPGVEARGHVADDETEVEFACSELLVEYVVVVALDGDDLQVRQFLAHGADQRWQHGVGDALEGADAQASGVARAELVEVVADAVELGEQCAAVFEQMCAERSEFDGSWPARTVEDLVADDPFE